eukprot:Rmarinus@m.20213
MDQLSQPFENNQSDAKEQTKKPRQKSILRKSSSVSTVSSPLEIPKQIDPKCLTNLSEIAQDHGKSKLALDKEKKAREHAAAEKAEKIAIMRKSIDKSKQQLGGKLTRKSPKVLGRGASGESKKVLPKAPERPVIGFTTRSLVPVALRQRCLDGFITFLEGDGVEDPDELMELYSECVRMEETVLLESKSKHSYRNLAAQKLQELRKLNEQ